MTIDHSWIECFKFSLYRGGKLWETERIIPSIHTASNSLSSNLSFDAHRTISKSTLFHMFSLFFVELVFKYLWIWLFHDEFSTHSVAHFNIRCRFQLCLTILYKTWKSYFVYYLIYHCWNISKIIDIIIIHQLQHLILMELPLKNDLVSWIRVFLTEW